jgi:hypothetical protein
MSTTKNILKPFQTVTAGNMSASITSQVTTIQFLDNLGLQLDWTGSPIGSFQVQVSADYNQDIMGNVLNAGSWSPIILTYIPPSGSLTTATSIPTSVGSPIYVDLNQTSAPYIRVVYIASSGSGSLNAYVTAKEI